MLKVSSFKSVIVIAFGIATFGEPIYEIRWSCIRIVLFNHRNACAGVGGNLIDRNAIP